MIGRNAVLTGRVSAPPVASVTDGARFTAPPLFKLLEAMPPVLMLWAWLFKSSLCKLPSVLGFAVTQTHNTR